MTSELRMREERKRTLQQNRAMHLFFRMQADALNDAGLDMKRTLEPGVDIPWTAENVKNHLWRPIQDAMLNKESTTELDTVDPSKIHKVLTRHLSDEFGIYVPWPDRFGGNNE